MAAPMLASWIKSQKKQSSKSRNGPAFYRNLEESLDIRRETHSLYTIKENVWKTGNSVDFCSNDILSLGASGQLREAFQAEIDAHPQLMVGAGGSRMMDGNYKYLEQVEDEVAQFHRAETGLIVQSGFEANLTIFAAIPRPGDVIVYDELVHASTHDGMERSIGTTRMSFRHNDPDSLRQVLTSVWDEHSLVRDGKRCVLIAVESFYSMEGDICPLEELMEVANEVFPTRIGNCQFIVDEAHSTGIIGPKGAGLVSHLRLESKVAIRLHTFGKALASSGAIILGNKTIKTALCNFARSLVFSTAPPFPVAAAIRAGYRLMQDGKTVKAQETIQTLARHLYTSVSNNETFTAASEKEIVFLPLAEDWEDQDQLTHIVPFWTKTGYSFWLCFHLCLAGFSAYCVDYPTVPKGTGRLRVTLHANNTKEEIDGLVASICEWAEEMMEIEKEGKGRVPRAARQVYASMADGDVAP